MLCSHQLSYVATRKTEDKAQLSNGDLIMDLITRHVIRDGIRIELTTKEFSLLEFLMRNVDKVVDRNAIARQVWGADFDPDSRACWLIGGSRT